MFIGKTFGQVSTEGKMKEARTITKTHMIRACGLFKDFNALHADALLAESLPLKTRIARGPLIAALLVGVRGNFFKGAPVAEGEGQILISGEVPAL